VKRENHEEPLAIKEWGWKYHHLGIPTIRHFQNETYLPQFKFYVCGFDTSPFGIEWMRFEADSPVSKLIQTIPHIAFEVDDLDLELTRHDLKIISKPESPSDGVRAAMIEHNGALIELIEFKNNKKK
jgi:catechol 2,3-dioxygenase-like lactoylglutathione lyase family enzyme